MNNKGRASQSWNPLQQWLTLPQERLESRKAHQAVENGTRLGTLEEELPRGPERVGRKDRRWVSGSRCWELEVFWVVRRFTGLVRSRQSQSGGT